MFILHIYILHGKLITGSVGIFVVWKLSVFSWALRQPRKYILALFHRIFGVLILKQRNCNIVRNHTICTYVRTYVLCIRCLLETAVGRDVATVPPRGNVALARIFLSSGEFYSIVSRVHLLFYNTNLEKLQWICVRRSCHSTS